MISGSELIEVEFVSVEKDFEINVFFNNGLKKKIDLSPLLQNPPPVFLLLREQREFKKISVNAVGGIQWECGADLSADYLLSA